MSILLFIWSLAVLHLCQTPTTNPAVKWVAATPTPSHLHSLKQLYATGFADTLVYFGRRDTVRVIRSSAHNSCNLALLSLFSLLTFALVSSRYRRLRLWTNASNSAWAKPARVVGAWKHLLSQIPSHHTHTHIHRGELAQPSSLAFSSLSKRCRQPYNSKSTRVHPHHANTSAPIHEPLQRSATTTAAKALSLIPPRSHSTTTTILLSLAQPSDSPFIFVLQHSPV